nr:retrovirus-related Pol polyprotein from transposon TNT 1-94 [Tanacetum cinerariifolium]
MKCFNCQGEGHMARQCLKPKRKRDAMWFREKVLLVEDQGNGKVLNEEELELLTDPAKAVLWPICLVTDQMFSPRYQTLTTHNDMLNQSVQEMPYSEPSYSVTPEKFSNFK